MSRSAIPLALVLWAQLAACGALAPHAVAQSVAARRPPSGASVPDGPVRTPELKLEFHRAERAWRSGSSLAEAHARLDRVLEALPGDAEARRLRARVFLDLGAISEALADAAVLVETDSADGAGWLLLAEARARDGDRPGALHALDRAGTLVTGGVNEHLRLSWIAQELGRVDQAEAFARVALALDPRRPAAYRRLARVFVAQGRSADAVVLLARGTDEGAVPPGLVPGDPVLAPLASHPSLARRR